MCGVKLYSLEIGFFSTSGRGNKGIFNCYYLFWI